MAGVGAGEAGRWQGFFHLGHWLVSLEISECLLRASNKRPCCIPVAALVPFPRRRNRGTG